MAALAYVFSEGAINSPSYTMYWPKLLSAIALAFVSFFLYYRSSHTLKEFIRFMFSKKIWLHSSTFADAQILVFNRSMLLILGISTGIILVYSDFARSWFGYLSVNYGRVSINEKAGPLLTLGYSALILLAADFKTYWVHRLSHSIPFLWEFHKVHHSARVLTPITVKREHLFYQITTMAGKYLMLLMINPTLHYFFGKKLVPHQLLGVWTGLLLFDFFGANLRHSHIWLSFGKHVSHVINSPAMHQIHHSMDPKHWNKNYARIFSFWDLIFGTIYIPSKKEDLKFGLNDNSHIEHSNFVKAFFFPIYRSWNQIVGRNPKPTQSSN